MAKAPASSCLRKQGISFHPTKLGHNHIHNTYSLSIHYDAPLGVRLASLPRNITHRGIYPHLCEVEKENKTPSFADTNLQPFTGHLMWSCCEYASLALHVASSLSLNYQIVCHLQRALGPTTVKPLHLGMWNDLRDTLIHTKGAFSWKNSPFLRVAFQSLGPTSHNVPPSRPLMNNCTWPVHVSLTPHSSACNH